jgi:hypothetical protein
MIHTNDWVSVQMPRLLIIGHDPRLQQSETLAGYALFADYYFRNEPFSSNEKSKFELAKSTFKQIEYLTAEKYKPDCMYVTNLCNTALQHAPKGKTVLIPEKEAEIGVECLFRILINNPTIEYIFPMSQQVNYWLHKLEFYNSDTDFQRMSVPTEKGLKYSPPYYQPKINGAFRLICGKRYHIKEGNQIIIPTLHSKNYPLKGSFHKAYGESYRSAINYFRTELPAT